MSKNLEKGLKAWFGDDSKVEDFTNRVKDAEDKIEEQKMITRTEEEAESEEGEVAQEEEVQVIEEAEEIEFELGDEDILNIANSVADILEQRLAVKLDKIAQRLEKVETRTNAIEDQPKKPVVKIRYRSEEPQEQPSNVSNFATAKANIAEIRKNRVAAMTGGN